MRKIIMTMLLVLLFALSFAPRVYASDTTINNEMVSLGKDEPSFIKEGEGKRIVCVFNDGIGRIDGVTNYPGWNPDWVWTAYYFPENGSLFIEIGELYTFLKTESGESTLLGWSDEEIHRMTVEKEKRLFFKIYKDLYKNNKIPLWGPLTASQSLLRTYWNDVVVADPIVEKILTGYFTLEDHWEILEKREVNIHISLAKKKFRFVEKNQNHLIFEMTEKGQPEAITVKCYSS